MSILETGITPPETEAFASVPSHEFFPGADEGVGSEINALNDEGIVLFSLEPKGIGERVHNSLSAAYDFGRDNLRKVALPAVLVGGAIASACGGGESNLAATATVEPTPTHGQTVIVVELTPTPTATPTEVRPTATSIVEGPTEAQKAETRANAIPTIDGIVDTFKKVTDPQNYSPDFMSRQGELADLAKLIDADFKDGKVSDAKVKLLEFKERVRQLGNVLPAKIIPVEVQRKHDPTGKYFKTERDARDREGKYFKMMVDDRVDPIVLGPYLKIVDLFVAYDNVAVK